MKQKFYTTDSIKKVDANYNIILGERSNGKSYAVTTDCLKEAWHTNGIFILLRRWKDEIQNVKIESYFDDKPIADITNGIYDTIVCYRQELFFAKFNEEGKKEAGKKCGMVMYLKGEQRYKSMSFPDYTNIIFEEFISKDGYLYEEPTLLQSIVSTVFRRRKGTVWLIGNKISRVCPYFTEWQLTNVLTQKENTIDVYTFTTNQIDEETGTPVSVKIAVEMTGNYSKNSKMFFGQKSLMTVSGEWETKEYPHLLKPYREYKKVYEILLIHDNMKFYINILMDDNKEMFLYVYPATSKSVATAKRVISPIFSSNHFVTPTLTELTRGDKIVKYLYDNNKICFSDNLTGADFNAIIKSKGGI